MQESMMSTTSLKSEEIRQLITLSPGEFLQKLFLRYDEDKDGRINKF
jgi:Ca2+-binding EF-hand superfamily protein